MWAISIHHTITNSATAPGLYCTIKRSTFSSKALPSKIFWLWACTGSHKHHEPVYKLPKIGWACSTLHPKLGSAYRRSLGNSNCGWVPAGFHIHPAPTLGSTRGKDFRREGSISDTRSHTTAGEGCNSGDQSISRQLCFPDFPGGEKGWGAETCNQPEGSQPIRQDRKFQNGGPAHPSRASTSRGLDGKNGSERCIPSDTHSSNISATPDLPVEGQVLKVHLSAIWSLGSSKGVYQGPEASGGLLKASRLSSDYLPGRSTDVTSGQGTTPPISTIILPTLRESESDSKPKEIPFDTHAEPGVPRVQYQLSINGDVSPSRETEENPTRCQTTVVSVNPVNSAGSTVCRESHSYNEGFTNSTSTLQSNTEVNEFCGSIPRELANTREIRCCSAAGPSQQSRTELVDYIGQENNFSSAECADAITVNRFGCIHEGLGCDTEQSDSHRGTLVPKGGILSHQLLGTPSSLSSNEGVREGLAEYNSPTQLGQCNSGGIYQPERGDNLQRPMSSGHLNVDVVPRKEHHLGCRTPSRSPQRDCKPGITFHEGPLRLDAQPQSIPDHSGCDGPTGSGSVCDQIDKSTPKVLQLESRPRSSGHRCIPTGLVTVPRICKSTLVSDPPMSHQSQGSSSTNGTNNTILEDPVLVPRAIGDVGGLPQNVTNPVGSGHDANGAGVSNARGSSTTDRLAHLRESYASQGLSDEASKLMLSS